MRQLIFAVMFVVVLTFANTCAAQDVWVAHWNYENVDIYAMEDTLRDTSSSEYLSFEVSAKFVKNGQLQQVVNWEFLKYKSKRDMWRYETSTMDGSHTTVVIPKSGLFEFCMKKLGWSYEIKDNYYY